MPARLSLLDPSQRAVPVIGTASAAIRSELVVKVDGPGQVTRQIVTGANVKILLNIGRSMPDIGYHGFGPAKEIPMKATHTCLR